MRFWKNLGKDRSKHGAEFPQSYNRITFPPMENEEDKIFEWSPGSGEIVPKRKKGWWVQYPKPSCSPCIETPLENQSAAFRVGDLVRLKGKPEKVRRVLSIVWHCHRYEFVYIIETSVLYPFGLYSSPYWFAPQLTEAHEEAPVQG
jgi:hypothetical protein